MAEALGTVIIGQAVLLQTSNDRGYGGGDIDVRGHVADHDAETVAVQVAGTQFVGVATGAEHA